jgi:hypothetical protein
MFPVFSRVFPPSLTSCVNYLGDIDAFFSVDEAACYKRDLPDAYIHILDGVHMVLETNFDEMLNCALINPLNTLMLIQIIYSTDFEMKKWVNTHLFLAWRMLNNCGTAMLKFL